MRTAFIEHLIKCNDLHRIGFNKLVFCPGMLFQSTEKWWGDKARRTSPHEGIDLCLFENSQGERFRLDETTRIPLFYEGHVIKIIDDFIGKSIFVRHEIFDQNGKQLHTIYGHTAPAENILPNRGLNQGDVIATIEDAEKAQSMPLNHLHISTAWLPVNLEPEDLAWDRLSHLETDLFCDPLEIMDCRYSLTRNHSSGELSRIYQKTSTALKP